MRAFTRFLAEEPAIPQYIHIYDAAPGLVDYVTARPDEFGCKVRKRVQLQYQKAHIAPQAFYAAIDVEATEINEGNIASLAPLGLDLEHRFWDSKEHFINQGYGIFLTAEAVPVAVCYAAAVGNRLAEVDILTDPAHQKKGLAKYAAALFVEQSLKRGIETNWDCFEDNPGSLRTANALGFTAVKSYQLLSLYLKHRL